MNKRNIGSLAENPIGVIKSRTAITTGNPCRGWMSELELSVN
jgi:hypothetical protein